MELFDKLLFEDLEKAYEKADINSEDMEEMFERFSYLEHLKEVKPYILTMRFFGWGTEKNQEQVLSELEKLIALGQQELKGLYFDLKLQQNDAKCEQFLNLLQKEIDEGYTNKYLKEKSLFIKCRNIMLRQKCLGKIDVGAAHTIAKGKDGSVLVAGREEWNRAVSSWRDVMAVSAGGFSAAAVKEDGTILFTGSRMGTGDMKYMKEVPKWSNIKYILAGDACTVGLKNDGTVISFGANKFGECNTEGWKDIIMVSTGGNHTVGLKDDGTVLATGKNRNGECNISDWKDIIDISAGTDYTLGLTKSGKVLATTYLGEKYRGQCEVNAWSDIVAISACSAFSLGLKVDGTVVSTKIIGEDREKLDFGQTNVEKWRNIAAVKCSALHSVGVQADGMLVATGDNKYGQCDIVTWRI